MYGYNKLYKKSDTYGSLKHKQVSIDIFNQWSKNVRKRKKLEKEQKLSKYYLRQTDMLTFWKFSEQV